MHWSDAEYAVYLQQRARMTWRDTQGVRVPPEDSTEAALRARILRVATPHGWLHYHTWDSRKSDEGFPDDVFVRPGRLIFAELKSRTGKPTAAQARWLSMLARSVPGVETYLWRPGDFGAIERLFISGGPDAYAPPPGE